MQFNNFSFISLFSLCNISSVCGGHNSEFDSLVGPFEVSQIAKHIGRIGTYLPTYLVQFVFVRFFSFWDRKTRNVRFELSEFPAILKNNSKRQFLVGIVKKGFVFIIISQ